MIEIINSVKNKIKELSNLEKVYNFHIKIYDKEDIDLIFYHFYKIIYNNKNNIFELKKKRLNQDTFREEIIKICFISKQMWS